MILTVYAYLVPLLLPCLFLTTNINGIISIISTLLLFYKEQPFKKGYPKCVFVIMISIAVIILVNLPFSVLSIKSYSLFNVECGINDNGRAYYVSAEPE